MVLPLRAYPLLPILTSQRYSQVVPANNASPTIESVKSWSLDADYRHTYVAQDTLTVTLVLNERPAPQRFMLAAAGQDLLDALAQFQTAYPRIQAAFDSDLRSNLGSDDGAQAVAAFVVLVQYLRGHFAFMPSSSQSSSATNVTGTSWTLNITEQSIANSDPAKYRSRCA